MIDWGRISELQNEIGKDSFTEVVQLFLEEADEAIEQLLAGAKVSDVESRLHFIKGSALNLGLSELAALCQAGERRAANGAAQDVDLNEIADTYALSRSAFLNGLNEKVVA